MSSTASFVFKWRIWHHHNISSWFHENLLAFCSEKCNNKGKGLCGVQKKAEKSCSHLKSFKICLSCFLRHICWDLKKRKAKWKKLSDSHILLLRHQFHLHFCSFMHKMTGLSFTFLHQNQKKTSHGEVNIDALEVIKSIFFFLLGSLATCVVSDRVFSGFLKALRTSLKI